MKIGVLGGGQLGRMLLQESISLDLNISFMDSTADTPVGSISSYFSEGDITSYDDVIRFCKDKDIITVEIEHVNIDALKQLKNEGKIVHPAPTALETIKNKSLQKQFYKKHDIDTSSFWITNSINEVIELIEDGKITIPFIQKAATGGYDGKGVQIIHDTKDIWEVESVIEPLVDIEKEIGVIACRNQKGDIACYDPVEMYFDPELNLVKRIYSPSQIADDLVVKSKLIAQQLIEKLDICGLLAVEFFITTKGELLVNEVAPRPHNSGHLTMDSHYCSQFENHLRGICNFPLGSTEQHTPVGMLNILGEDNFLGDRIYLGIEDLLKVKRAHLHLYGKRVTKPFRKMGHVNVLGQNRKEIDEKINTIEQYFKVIA